MNSVEHVLLHLQQRERVLRLKIGLMGCTGPFLCFAGPAAIASMFWPALQYGWTPAFLEGVGWVDLFVMFSALMIPLLFHLEFRYQGKFRADFEDVVPVRPGYAAIVGMRSLAVGGILMNARFTSSALVELFLIGPRLCIAAWQLFAAFRYLRGVSRMRASQLVASLLSSDTGVEIRGLLERGEKSDSLIPVLAYLSFFKWIGAAKGWERIWLFSESRRVLSA